MTKQYYVLIKKCSDCEVTLVEKLEDKSTIINEKKEIELEFLVKVAGNVDLGIIESKLSQFGIPVVKKFDNSAGFNSGLILTEYYIFVPSELLEKTKEIIELET